ncbi:ABC transporter substrate-binding protein [soil metagenome]
MVAIITAISLATVLGLGNAVFRSPAPQAPGADVSRAAGSELRIAGSAPASWDPALQSDAGSAGTLAQIYEGLTAFDAQSQVQPALAESWQLQEEGRRLVFLLRPGLRFSDGSPLTAQDVVRSWLRLLDPDRPAPLASLLADVRGAATYLQGEGTPDEVGLRADGDQVIVEFRRPASYFLAAAASPSLSIVPEDLPDGIALPVLPRDLVVSGAYRPTEQIEQTITLEANEHYWAGTPALTDVQIVTDLEGRSPVDAFTDGAVDYTPISASDASWIRYDESLGPQLRRTESFSVDYYGFDTARPPFDDPLVRRAFAQAVDWDRLVRLADADSMPATSLVPPGIADRSEVDFSPVFDPDAARAALAEAGYPGGEDFPEVALSTSGYSYDEAIARELGDVLGVTVRVEARPFDELFQRLQSDSPPFWALSWIADYPDQYDFLGLLLETGSTNNYSRWSNSDYDAALQEAATTTDPAEQARWYEAAQRIVQEQAPVIPVSYGESWALSRAGLLGAVESGVGLIRYAGLAWSP